MKRSFFIISLILLFGCSGQHNKLNKLINSSNKVEVFMFDTSSTENAIKIFESGDPVRIDEFKSYFTNKHIAPSKFNYTGKFVLKTDKKDINVMYCFKPDSSYVSYMIDYKLYSMKLSANGMKFLKSAYSNFLKNPNHQNKVNSSEQTD